MRTGWLLPGICAVLGLAQLIDAIRSWQPVPLVLAVLFFALTGWLLPMRLPVKVDQDGAIRAVGEGEVVIYYRAGCPYCLRLQRSLGAAGRAEVVWVDIWDDPEAAAFVRSVTGGDETVPTVVIEGIPMINPPPDQVVAALHG
ncbi:glutaredoxin domain-containing protein [Austwickia chelonae]|uniref:glutaredoxin domain-containing protein n=1 Tax=Austwickia chelonae TaxID=100225 RepID=UPI000E27E1FF|nr:glutaredoxin domain-containing protein [Austwickia chelonae]